MPAAACATCQNGRAVVIRPKNGQKLCKACFIKVFEQEIHNTITSARLFRRGERIAVGASGGKDSTVLAAVLKTLNERHDYGLDLTLLSIDEGIKGYRDDSLETVKRNAVQYDLPLTILGYDELYGWTMDQVVSQIGKKGNCTYCGVFRRQALDRGAAKLGINHVVTGHNADDVAETVLMNLLRGDLPRLARSTSIVTSSAASAIRRSKPLKYAYEKEIVLYAHHRRLDYFTTECIYSPEAFRGSARALIKDLERVRPTAILDVVRSGEDMAKLVPNVSGGLTTRSSGTADDVVVVMDDDEDESSGQGGCGKSDASKLSIGQDRTPKESFSKASLEEDFTAVSTSTVPTPSKVPASVSLAVEGFSAPSARSQEDTNGSSERTNSKKQSRMIRQPRKQEIRKCRKCGYLSSQEFCQACTLLDGLNRHRPEKMATVTLDDEESGSPTLVRRMEGLQVDAG